MSKLLQKMKEAQLKAEERARELQSGQFFDIPDGTTVIRLLPSVELMDKLEKDELVDERGVCERFYKTISYHYIPTGRDANGKDTGKYLYTQRYYELESNGATQREQDPLDYFANLCFKSDIKEYKNLYSTVKRKRFYIMSALVYDKDGNPKLVTLRDKSNDGALVKQLCKILGEKFQLDTSMPAKSNEEETDGKTGEFEESVQVKDILSTELGYRVAIVKKVKKKMIDTDDGQKPINLPDYSETKTSKDATPLTAEEQALYLQRKPLSDMFEYASYEEAEKAFEEFVTYKQVDLNRLSSSASSEKSAPKEKASSKPKAKETVETSETRKEKPVHEDLSAEDKSLLDQFE